MKPMPSPSSSFCDFCGWFFQDICNDHTSFDAAVSAYIAQLDAAGSADLSASLGELLASDASDEELRKLWSDCGAEWSVSPIRPFFEQVRAQLAGGSGP
jgi:hypothetical protein